MFVCSKYHDESLRPPPESGDGEEDASAEDLGEALIDCAAYMLDERNHTSARCRFTSKAAGEAEEELQVTFCLAPPRHISYFCICYTSGEPTRFISEPLILATERNLALISVAQGPTWLPRSTDYTYLVYHAAAPATLTVLPLPTADLFPEEHCYLTQGEVGILVYTKPDQANKEEEQLYDTSYKIAALYTREDEVSGTRHYDLYIYDASTDAWTREHTVFSHQTPPPTFCSDRVITVAGTMIWVDLSQGMILCQVHLPPGEDSRPRQLRYVRLPRPLQPRDHLPLCVSTSSFSRDIAIVNDSIGFVDLEIWCSPGSPIPDRWTAVKWSMAVDDSEFHKDWEVKSADVASHAALDDTQTFFVAHPTLSSRNVDILYLMAKASLDPLDTKTSVIAVNMTKRKMERVAKYTTQRGGSMDSAYMLTTISKYLAPPGGNPADSNAILKKRAPTFLGSPRRKATATSSRYGGDQVEEEEEDSSRNPPSMKDNMDLE